MHRISSEKESLAIQMFLKGYTSRMVAEDVGVDKNTAWTLRRRIIQSYGPILCPCGKVSGHTAWCSFRIERFGIPWQSQLKEISTFNIYIPTRPRYERPDIPNERETEIPMLVNQRAVRSFDAPASSQIDRSLYELFASPTLDPCTMLMLKEHQESRAFQEREFRIEQWERHIEKQTSAFKHLK